MARGFSVTVRGDRRLARNLRRLGARSALVVERALFETGERMMGDAKELTPVDTGALRASGFVMTDTMRSGSRDVSGEAERTPQTNRRTVSAVLGFGGPSVPYALRQHEELTYRHRVGQAKYLETPVKSLAGEVPHAIADHVRREVRRGRPR